MNIRYSLGGGALLAAMITGTAGFAEVTSQQVWENWRGYLTSYGYEVTATEDMSGGTLTLSGVTMTMNMPEDSGMVSVTLGDMTFTEQGDGTVAVGLPAEMPVKMHIAPTDGEVADVTVNYGLTGFSMIVSGSEDEMTYAFTGSEMSMKLAELVVDGDVVGNAKAEFSLKNVVGRFETASGDSRTMKEFIRSDGMSYDIGFVDPGGEGSFFMNGSTDSVNMAMSMTIPDGIDMEDMNAALKAGFSIDAAVGLGAGKTEFSLVDGSNTASGNSSSSGSSLKFQMNSDSMAYGIAATDYAISLIGSDIPLPINLSAENAALRMAMPVAKSDTPQDFSMLVKMVGLAPDDMIWSMLDPTGALSHAPATLIVDMAGKANWLFDIMDPEQAEMMADADMPGELHALTLNNLTLSVAGAELTGAGAFTFNNDDLETFDGMPAPDGQVDLKLVGGNGLIDNLISMGMMSEDDAMGARMMMGLFGRPGEGEDTVESTIEVKSNGQIFANGQRLQ